MNRKRCSFVLALATATVAVLPVAAGDHDPYNNEPHDPVQDLLNDPSGFAEDLLADPTGYLVGQCPPSHPVGVFLKTQYNLCCKQPGNLKDWLMAVIVQDWISSSCIWV